MKNLLLFQVLFLTLLFAESISSTIIEVPGDYSTIQQAINAAADGDTVLVAPDTYYENLNFIGKNILVTSHYILNKDISFISNTIIDGSQPNHTDTASCVLFINGETQDAILQGFTLTGGKGTRWQDIHIGGFYREGGGILIELSSPTIQFNLISFNDATDKTNCTSAGGGAIRCGDGDPIIRNNVIVKNKGRYGAGIVMNFATGTIRNNLILENTGGVDFGGSGIWSYAAGNTIIENNTIINNHSDLDGGGILIWATSATIKNNIIRDNTAVTTGPQIRLRSGGTVDVTYSNIEGGWTGTGNIDSDPLFETMKLYLADTSLSVDAGDPNPLYNDPEDTGGMAQWPSKGTVRNDMGAYGGPRSAELSDYTITSVEHENNFEQPQGFILHQNYPNPFNPSTKIRFTIYELQFTILTIYDVLGNEMATFIDEDLPAGEYEVDFNAQKFSGGIYFYQLKVGDYSESKKMVLLR